MENNEVLKIARKWYEKIPFPKCFEEEFEELFAKQHDLECTTYDVYMKEHNQDDHGKNLLMLLYFFQELSERYEAAGIPEEILIGTIADIVVGVQRYHLLNGSIGLANLSGWEEYMHMCLFRIGRLQFCMFGAYVDIPEKGIKAGDPVMDVHVPIAGPLTMEACEDAFQRAEVFFTTYFPDYHYKYYTCFSWLFDDVLQKFLKEDSNILKFQKLFEPVYKREQDSILHFMFRFGFKDREEIRDCEAKTDFAKKVKEYALNGGVFHNVLAVKEHTQKG